MLRERIDDDIYVFTSSSYAHVTCGAILTKDGVVLIDTLYFPDEAREVRDFIELRLNQQVKYVINTHYHADHTTGTYLYPQATVIGHAMCRELLDSVGREGLERTKSQSTDFSDANIILPSIIVRDGTLDITVGGKTLRLIHMPGHSPDLMGVLVVNNSVLFAADTMMPVPTFFDGSYEDLRSSLAIVRDLNPSTVVQGHGEVILRGEVDNIIRGDLEYLDTIKEEVESIIEEELPKDSLDQISIESCGKSRIPLNGLVADLHAANLYRLYDDLTNQNGESAS